MTDRITCDIFLPLRAIENQVNQVATVRMGLNPFECEPLHVSRIAGLGGTQPSPDPDYAFRTVPLAMPAGHLEVAIAFDRLRATRGALLIEITEGAGIERRQVGLRTTALAELAARGGVEHMAITSDRRGAYSVAGYIHDDTDASADGMEIQITVNRLMAGIEGAAQPEAMARVPRLAGLALPSFAHPSSQTWSSAQLDEPAYHGTCRALGLETDTASWPEAFIYQALRSLLGDLSGLRGFGVTAFPGVLASALQSQGIETIASASADPAQWPLLAGMDFAWFMKQAPVDNVGILIWTALALIDRLRPGGALVMVLPFEHGRMSHEPCDVLTRNDVEILGLKLLAQGHGVAQLKFRPANRAFHPGTRTPFGLMLRKVS